MMIMKPGLLILALQIILVLYNRHLSLPSYPLSCLVLMSTHIRREISSAIIVVICCWWNITPQWKYSTERPTIRLSMSPRHIDQLN
ncbi:hypothetical protein GGR51DRAFT_260418 [Nemania sp. FL0031]|nr:hypothetical protein GGR51DRAFT_260418 [Nemania sp. FL0031]